MQCFSWALNVVRPIFILSLYTFIFNLRNLQNLRINIFDIFPLSFFLNGIKSIRLRIKMKDQRLKPEKRKILIRDQPREKKKPTVESLERLLQRAEEKGWIKKKAHSS